MNVSKLSEGELETFQFGRWRLTIPGALTTIITLYHSPYSVIYPITSAVLIDEFTNWIINILVDNKNVTLMGDFNIHINNEDNPEAVILAGTLQALGFQCHTSFPTHKHGNTLDLICTEIFSGIKVKDCTEGPYISDHCVVRCKLGIPKNNIINKSLTFRKLAGVDSEAFVQNLGLKDLENESDLNNLITMF